MSFLGALWIALLAHPDSRSAPGDLVTAFQAPAFGPSDAVVDAETGGYWVACVAESRLVRLSADLRRVEESVPLPPPSIREFVSGAPGLARDPKTSTFYVSDLPTGKLESYGARPIIGTRPWRQLHLHAPG